MKRKILVSVLICLAVLLLCGGIWLGHFYAITVPGNVDSLTAEFKTMRSDTDEPEYWDIWKDTLCAAEEAKAGTRYGLYIAVHENAKNHAELGIVKRTALGDLLGRAQILDYIVSEDSIGSYLMTDESGNGQAMILFGMNYEQVTRIEITYISTETGECTEDVQISGGFPIHYILRDLGTSERQTKQIVEISLYNAEDVPVYSYRPA